MAYCKKIPDGMSKCAACHVIDENGCCSDEIFITLHDAIRLEKKTGIPVDKLVYWRKVSKELAELNEGEDFAKLWRDGYMLSIDSRHAEDYECRFLGEEGCSVFSHRPRICRVFPFWFKRDKSGKLIIYLDKEEDPEDDFCRICRDNHADDSIKGALADCDEDEGDLREFCVAYEKEMELYDSYADDLAAGMKPSEVIKKHNLSLAEY